MIVAFKHDKNSPPADTAEGATGNRGLARKLGQAKPEDIHGRGGLDRFKASEPADEGKAPIGTNRQFGTKLVFHAIVAEIAYADDRSVFLYQALHLGVHHQFEFWILRGLASDEFQKANLGDNCNVGKARLEAPEIERAKRTVCKLKRGAGDFAVRNLEQFVREPDLVEDFQDGRVNSVTTELAVEIFVHFEESHGNAAARKEKSKHGAGGSTTDDTTRSFLDITTLVLGERGLIHIVFLSKSFSEWY